MKAFFLSSITLVGLFVAMTSSAPLVPRELGGTCVHNGGRDLAVFMRSVSSPDISYYAYGTDPAKKGKDDSSIYGAPESNLCIKTSDMHKAYNTKFPYLPEKSVALGTTGVFTFGPDGNATCIVYDSDACSEGYPVLACGVKCGGTTITLPRRIDKDDQNAFAPFSYKCFRDTEKGRELLSAENERFKGRCPS